MRRLVRGLVRGLVRITIRAAVLAGVTAAVRYAIGRLSGEPGLHGTGSSTQSANGHAGAKARGGGKWHVPMSFDRWPAVPQAPSRPAQTEADG